ncbi:hypothetical protein OAD84_03430 [Pelagibacterales bacterium]|nr:hypothetical protein [Pelagibacterales bacterium]
MNDNYYLEAKPKLIKVSTPLGIFVFICGLFASQRFSLDGLNVFICILPYAFFFPYFLSKKLDIALSLIVISLFLVCDNGGGVYTQTPTIIRYMIYVSGLLMLIYLSRPKIAHRKLLFLIILAVVLLMTTLPSQMLVFDRATFQRDILVFIILSLVLISRSEVQLSLPLLFATSFGFLIGELVNINLFFSYSDDYMNYNSLKSFIVFPFLYVAFIKKEPLFAIGLFFLTILIMFNYGSRMLIGTFALLLLLAFMVDKFKHLRTVLLLTIFMSMLIVVINIYELPAFDPGASKYKAVMLFLNLINVIGSLDILSTLKALDLTRFTEYQLFFSRPLFEVIFGSGLGSGIVDTEGLLGFVEYNDTAFSVEEINNSVYFSLHDYWTDLGLRFGFLAVVFTFYLVSIKQMLLGRLVCGILFSILLLNTFFATSGLIFIALIIKFYPSEMRAMQSNKEQVANGASSL